MEQSRKFEKTFLNEYLACKLHEQDVEERGREQVLVETARILLSMGLSVETIKQGTGLSEEEIEALK